MNPNYYQNEFINKHEGAFTKEYLLVSGNGSYSSSTIGGCNVRKYHGLFITEQPQIDDNDHIIVSALDEQIVYGSTTYEVGTHKYPGTIHPKGYQYVDEFFGEPVPRWIYKLGDCVLIKELLMPDNEQTLLIRYTIAEASEKVYLKISPFLAFRSVHDLKKASLVPDKKVQLVNNGIKVRLYPEYSPAFIQVSQKAEFVADPDWYYNIEYPCEQKRGYDYTEDLYVPGHFCLKLKNESRLVVYIGLKECNPKFLSTRFSNALRKQPPLNTETECLKNAAKQFVIKNNNELKVKAGYHWFGSWGRDTFISLPGLLLTTGQTKQFAEVIKSSLPDLKNGLMPNIGRRDKAVYNSIDASLWFIWAIQQYAAQTNARAATWNEYGSYLKEILDSYKNGTGYNIKMDSDGLISAGGDGVALTWMDAVVNGYPVTPRKGKAIEINALWYNAVCFCLDIATDAGDNEFTCEWESYPGLISRSIISNFWDADKRYLADCIDNGMVDWSIRPNQVFALSMPYSPIPDFLKLSVLEVIEQELLTPKGLRTLSPKDKKYKGRYEGDQEARDGAYHQGTIWPWLTGHFAQACLNVRGYNGFLEVMQIDSDCKSMIGDQCLFTVSEIYNGDYPHEPAGAVSQAWSVAEFLRMKYLLSKFKVNNEACQPVAV